jgi:hypothetical protein
MVQEIEVIEIDIDGRTYWVRLVGSWVLVSNNVVAVGLALSLDKPLEWAVGFFFGNVELSLEFWTVISGISPVLSEKPSAHGFIDRMIWAAGKSIEPASRV